MKVVVALIGAAILSSPAAAAPAPATLVQGKTLFVAACGSCHTLAAARTHGRKGPNLNDEGSSYGDVVDQVVEGGGGMPSFARSLTRAQIRAIATFVAHAAASAGDD